jgi:hypothetical protein
MQIKLPFFLLSPRRFRLCICSCRLAGLFKKKSFYYETHKQITHRIFYHVIPIKIILIILIAVWFRICRQWLKKILWSFRNLQQKSKIHCSSFGNLNTYCIKGKIITKFQCFKTTLHYLVSCDSPPSLQYFCRAQKNTITHFLPGVWLTIYAAAFQQ